MEDNARVADGVSLTAGSVVKAGESQNYTVSAGAIIEDGVNRIGTGVLLHLTS